MHKESGRSKQANRKKEHSVKQEISAALRDRNVHNRKNVNKDEAREFAGLFLPSDVVSEYEYGLQCKKIKNSISAILRRSYTPDDIELLEKGYRNLPKRWQVFLSHINGIPHITELNDEIEYVKHCDNALGKGWK